MLEQTSTHPKGFKWRFRWALLMSVALILGACGDQ